VSSSKKCSKCEVEKPLSEFRKRSKRDTYQSWCKKCEKCYQRKSESYKWQKLKNNLKRYPKSDVTLEQIKSQLGEPDTCYLCGLPLKWEHAEVDHVIPLTKGGMTTISNLKWAHKKCNRMKHDYTIPELLERITLIHSNLSKRLKEVM